MAYVILDKKQHSSLRVLTNVEQMADKVNSLPVLADELRQLVLEFPVCIVRNPSTGKFALQALLGLEKGENLFLKNGRWSPSYIPAHLNMQPFMVGITDKEGEQPNDDNMVMTIDVDSPLVNTAGEALFLEDNTPSPFLKQKSQMAFALVGAMQRTEQLLLILEQNDLIEPIKLTVALANGNEKAIDGIFGINEQKLKHLNNEKLQEFNQKDVLSACHYLSASLGNIQKLVAIKNNL